jgi:hypothetical protein
MVFVLLFIVFIVVVIVLAVISEKKAQESWRQFAGMYGFSAQVRSGSYNISGWFDGVYVHAGTVTRGSGKNRHTYTQFSAMIQAALPYGLTVYQETIFSKMGKFLGGQDIQVGDQQLDEAFVIKGADPGHVQHFVRLPAVRAALFQLLSQHPNFVLEQGRVMVELNGRISDHGRMYGVILSTVQMVQAIHVAVGFAPPPAMPVAQPQQAAAIDLPVAAPARPAPKAAQKPAPKPAAPAPKAGGGPPMPRPDNTPRGDGGDFAVLDKLGDPLLGSTEREALLSRLRGKDLSLPVLVDRVELTSSFDAPEALKDGHTAVGVINGLRAKVAVRFPKARDSDVKGLRRGEAIHALGKVCGYDALFDRILFDAR